MVMQGLSANIGVRQARAEAMTLSSDLREFALQPIDMHVVGAGQAPELLPSDIGPAEHRRAGQIAPAVTVGVNRQIRYPPEFDHADKAHRVEARHDAGASQIADKIVAVAHLIEIAREIEGIHDLLARSVGVTIDDAHHGPGPIVKRAMRSIRLKFVVLDEVDASFAQGLGQGCCLVWPEADARLDDGADQRKVSDTGEASRSRNPEFRAGICVRECSGQTDVEEAQS